MADHRLPLRASQVEGFARALAQQLGVGLGAGGAAAPPGTPVGWIEARTSRLRGVDVPPEAVPSLIDEVPALAVAAAFADGVTRITGAAELRVKESDRIASLGRELTRLGGQVEELDDGLRVLGGARLERATCETLGDHRLAMGLAVAGLGILFFAVFFFIYNLAMSLTSAARGSLALQVHRGRDAARGGAQGRERSGHDVIGGGRAIMLDASWGHGGWATRAHQRQAARFTRRAELE